MKITDLALTLFSWPDIPPTTYGRHTGRFSGESQLGLLTLTTDGGLEGGAALRQSMNHRHDLAATSRAVSRDPDDAVVGKTAGAS